MFTTCYLVLKHTSVWGGCFCDHLAYGRLKRVLHLHCLVDTAEQLPSYQSLSTRFSGVFIAGGAASFHNCSVPTPS